jgi:hypothetical protein
MPLHSLPTRGAHLTSCSHVAKTESHIAILRFRLRRELIAQRAGLGTPHTAISRHYSVHFENQHLAINRWSCSQELDRPSAHHIVANNPLLCALMRQFCRPCGSRHDACICDHRLRLLLKATFRFANLHCPASSELWQDTTAIFSRECGAAATQRPRHCHRTPLSLRMSGV